MSNANLTVISVIYSTGDVANKAIASKKKIMENPLHQLFIIHFIT